MVAWALLLLPMRAPASTEGHTELDEFHPQ